MDELNTHIPAIIEQSRLFLINGDIQEARKLWKGFLDGILEKEDWSSLIEASGECIKMLSDFYSGYYNRGIALSETGNKKEALADLTKASELNAAHPPVLFNKASVELDLDMFDEADRDCQLLLYSGSAHPRFYNLAAEVKSMLGQNREAADYYAKALELKPNHAYYYIQRASVLGSNGDFIEAMQDLDTAENILKQMSTDDPNAIHLLNFYFARSQVKQQMGDVNGSQEDFEHFNRLTNFFSPKDGLSEPAAN